MKKLTNLFFGLVILETMIACGSIEKNLDKLTDAQVKKIEAETPKDPEPQPAAVVKTETKVNINGETVIPGAILFAPYYIQPTIIVDRGINVTVNTTVNLMNPSQPLVSNWQQRACVHTFENHKMVRKHLQIIEPPEVGGKSRHFITETVTFNVTSGAPVDIQVVHAGVTKTNEYSSAVYSSREISFSMNCPLILNSGSIPYNSDKSFLIKLSPEDFFPINVKGFKTL